MQRTHSLPAYAVFLLTAITLLPVSLSAQNIWLDHGWNRSIEIEYLKPNYEELSNTSPSASILFLSGRYPISDKTLFVVELPIVHASVKSDFSDESQTSIVNPYIGVETRQPGSRSSLEVGVRLPIMPDDQYLASSSGRVTDFDRRGAFLTDKLVFTGKGNIRWNSRSNKLHTRFRFGPTIWLSYPVVAELLIDYSLQAAFLVRDITLTGGLTGRFFASGYFEDIGDRFVNQIGVAASGELGSFRPGIYFRVPLDEDFLGAIDFVLGLNVGITFE